MTNHFYREAKLMFVFPLLIVVVAVGAALTRLGTENLSEVAQVVKVKNAQPAEKVHEKIAVEFALALAEGKVSKAHALMSEELKNKYTVERLGREFELMHAYSSEVPTEVSFVTSMEEFAGKVPGDLGWVYVGVSGKDWVEGITVVSARENSDPKVRQVIFGRP